MEDEEAGSSQDPISCALSIMRRMPPSKIEHNLSGLVNLIPEHMDELLQRVDQPLQVATDENGRAYLQCDYNRDGDSYRSPWSNTYHPPLDDEGFFPSAKLRTLEVEANQLLDAYRELYFEGGTSSVYMWDLDAEGSFAGCFLIKKSVSGHEFVSEGGWDSIHVVEATETAGSSSTANYKLTTTVIISMDVHKFQVGDSNLSGSLTRVSQKTSPVDADHTHIANIGSMIEDMETDIRTYLDSLYIQKTREIVSSIRKLYKAGPHQAQPFTMNLNAAVLKHGANRKIDSE